jgi:hypothetical protein
VRGLYLEVYLGIGRGVGCGEEVSAPALERRHHIFRRDNLQGDHIVSYGFLRFSGK